MWWWQSVALGGAFSLGGSVPIEYFTCWASALVEEASSPAAAAPDAALSTCRRVHREISISSSLKVEHRALLPSEDAARLPVFSSHRIGCCVAIRRYARLPLRVKVSHRGGSLKTSRCVRLTLR